jgi:hypothetical protein
VVLLLRDSVRSQAWYYRTQFLMEGAAPDRLITPLVNDGRDHEIIVETRKSAVEPEAIQTSVEN